MEFSSYIVSVDLHKIRITTENGFEMTNPDTGGHLFSSDFTKFNFPTSSKNLHTKQINSNRVSMFLFTLIEFVVCLDGKRISKIQMMILVNTCFTEAWRWLILHIDYKAHLNLMAINVTDQSLVRQLLTVFLLPEFKILLWHLCICITCCLSMSGPMQTRQKRHSTCRNSHLWCNNSWCFEFKGPSINDMGQRALFNIK